MINWLQKYQEGGYISQDQFQQLVAAAKSGDQKAAQILEQLAQQYPKIAELLSSMKQGGKFEYLHYLKCGGKTKKVSKKSMGGCSCKKTLARKGKKLVNVDCNGNIVK